MKYVHRPSPFLNKTLIKHTYNIVFWQAVIESLGKSPSLFDTKRLFLTGCSAGSAMAFWQAICLHQAFGSNVVSAFATHSTGLKRKGDKLNFPHGYGQCKDCEWWPAVPRYAPGLKACIFDNRGDHPFYQSSKHLQNQWEAVGNRGESWFGAGGHCIYHSGWVCVNYQPCPTHTAN